MELLCWLDGIEEGPALLLHEPAANEVDQAVAQVLPSTAGASSLQFVGPDAAKQKHLWPILP